VSWYDELRPISLQEALAEPAAERLDFRRPVPSTATIAALRKAEQPELLASDMRQMKARRRPRAA
jgi:hypothetical protein